MQIKERRRRLAFFSEVNEQTSVDFKLELEFVRVHVLNRACVCQPSVLIKYTGV